MRRIKILKTSERNYCYECHEDDVLIQHVTDWGEVDEVTFSKIERYCDKKNTGKWSYFIVEDPAISIPKCLEEFAKMIDAENKEKEINKKIRDDKKAIKDAKKEAKKKERDLKNLKELQDKYPS